VFEKWSKDSSVPKPKDRKNVHAQGTSDQVPSPPRTSGERVRVRGMISDFSLTLSLSRRERERRVIVSAT
jgi:hypothetical protein